MPINIDHVYTDRGRVHRKVKGARVNHETQIHETVSDWFRCRIAPAEGSEARELNRRQIEASHLFISNLKDVNGNPVSIQEDDVIEVEAGPPPFSSDSGYAGMYEIADVAVKPRNLQEELLWYVPLRRRKEY